MPILGAGDTQNAIAEYFREEYERTKTDLSLNQIDREGMRQYQSTNRLSGLMHLWNPASTNGNELEERWALEQQQNGLLLQFAVLIYLLYADDGRLDYFERRWIRRLFDNASLVLTETQRQGIVHLSSNAVLVDEIIAFIELKKFPPKIILDNLTTIKHLIHRKKRYQVHLDYLTNHLSYLTEQ